MIFDAEVDNMPGCRCLAALMIAVIDIDERRQRLLFSSVFSLLRRYHFSRHAGQRSIFPFTPRADFI